MDIYNFNKIKAGVKVGTIATLSDSVKIVITTNNHHLYCLLIEAVEGAESLGTAYKDDYKYLTDKANALLFALSSKAKPLYKEL